MRVLRKGGAYLYADGVPYGQARAGLAARIGRYCSYCERRENLLEVEHIQPKAIHPAKERLWSNFLLSCKNCNSAKRAKDPELTDWLIPDRDNTMAAFVYRQDGIVDIAPTVPLALIPAAKATLDLVDLNREVREVFDEAGNLVALDRRSQRLEAWLLAKRFRLHWDQVPSPPLQDAIMELARTGGFFSIWMSAFDGVAQIRQGFIQLFPGTESACFDPISSTASRAHPNADGLDAGGKL